MGFLFMRSQTISTNENRLGALRIQQSSQGLPIPVIYGTTRTVSNLLWYGNFQAIAETSVESEGGKGGGGVEIRNTTYTYTTGVIFGIGEGPLQADFIGTVWSNKNKTNVADQGLELFRGDYSQAAWSYMVTEFPDQARNMRGQAYAATSALALGNSDSLPNTSFEVSGLLLPNSCEPDVNAAQVVEDILTNTDYGLGFEAPVTVTDFEQYCSAIGFLVSPAYTTQLPGSEVIKKLAMLCNTAPVWSATQGLRFVPYADAEVSRVATVPVEEPGDVFLLLNYDNSVGATTAVDTSSWAHNVTVSNSEQTAAAAAFGSTGMSNQNLVGTNSGVSVPSMNVPWVPTSNMTLSGFVSVTSDPNAQLEFGKLSLSGGMEMTVGIVDFVSPDEKQLFMTLFDQTFNGPLFAPPFYPIPFGEVYWELDYRGDTQTGVLYIEGNAALSGTYSGNLPAITAVTGARTMHSGAATVAANVLNHDAERFTRNFLRHSGPFTPPSSAPTDDIPGPVTCVPDTTTTFTPDLTPQYSLGYGDFIAGPGEDPVVVERRRQADAFNLVQIECLDRSNDYNIFVAEAKDQASVERYGLRPMPLIKAHEVCDPLIARRMAQTIMQRVLYVRNRYIFTVGWRYARLDPMDIVTITDELQELSEYPVRILQIDEDDGALKIIAEDLLVGVSTAASYAVQPSEGYVVNNGTPPGDVLDYVVFQPPVELSGIPQVWAGAVGGPEWGGAEVWMSDDNASFSRVGVITSAARIGTLASNLPAGPDPYTGNIALTMSSNASVLVSATQAQADAEDTLSFIGTQTAGEIVAYSTTTLTAPQNYTLSDYTLRGLHCSFPLDHVAGQAKFMRLDGSVLRTNVTPSRVGETVYIKLLSFNRTGGARQALDDVGVIEYVVQPLGIVAVNGVVPSVIEASQVLCIPEGTQYSVLGRMTVFGRINDDGRLVVQ